MKNALLPIVSLLGVDLGLIISAGVIIEQIFAWPGFGQSLQSAVARDYPVIQACGFLVGATVLVSAILVDLAYGWLIRACDWEPRPDGAGSDAEDAASRYR